MARQPPACSVAIAFLVKLHWYLMIWISCRRRSEPSGLTVEALTVDPVRDETHVALRPENKRSLTFLDWNISWRPFTRCWSIAQPLYGPPSNVQGGASVSKVMWSTQRALANILFIYWRACVWGLWPCVCRDRHVWPVTERGRLIIRAFKKIMNTGSLDASGFSLWH